MKLLLFVLHFQIVLLLALQQPARADTIDYWTVHYNTTRLQTFGEYAKKATITINAANVQETDTLTITYFADAPCGDCLTTVTIENGKHRVITGGTGAGTRNPVKVPLWPLLQYQHGEKKGVYEVFYRERRGDKRVRDALVFRIMLE